MTAYHRTYDLTFNSYYMSLTGHVSPNKMSETDVRVVVISPEDRERVTALMNTLWETASRSGRTPENVGTVTMQAALRSLLTPPKPDEPRGRYAVVEDDEGREWCRIDTAGTYVWQVLGVAAAKHERRYAAWRDINAARVLREGVTA